MNRALWRWWHRRHGVIVVRRVTPAHPSAYDVFACECGATRRRFP